MTRRYCVCKWPRCCWALFLFKTVDSSVLSSSLAAPLPGRPGQGRGSFCLTGRLVGSGASPPQPPQRLSQIVLRLGPCCSPHQENPKASRISESNVLIGSALQRQQQVAAGQTRGMDGETEAQDRKWERDLPEVPQQMGSRARLRSRRQGAPSSRHKHTNAQAITHTHTHTHPRPSLRARQEQRRQAVDMSQSPQFATPPPPLLQCPAPTPCKSLFCIETKNLRMCRQPTDRPSVSAQTPSSQLKPQPDATPPAGHP